VTKTMYIPLAQIEGAQPSNCNFLVRVAAGDPRRLARAVEALVRETDAGLRLRSIESYPEIVDRTLRTERTIASLGGFFALLALLLACLGIFGLMTFRVSRRVNDIGLRMALGATRTGVVTLILREVALMLAFGCVIGTAAAVTLSGLTKKMLYEITPTEPAVFALAAFVLGIAAFGAAWLPARRASRVDPLVALRHE